MPNPMDRFLRSSVDPSRGRGGWTGAAPAEGAFDRGADYSKFFTYIHRYEPLAAGARDVIDQFQIDGDADFWINKQARLNFDELNQERLGVAVKFEVSPISETYNFVESFLSHYGTGQRPNQYPPNSPIKLPRNAVFSVHASDRNLIATPTTNFIAHHGGKVYASPIVQARRYLQREPYLYMANFTDFGNPTDKTIPAGQVGVFTLRLDGNSDFDVRKLTVLSDAPILLQIQTDDDNWFQRAIRGELLGGSLIETPGLGFASSGEYPFMLPHPRFVTKAAYININVTNLDQVSANRVQIGFWGQRLYPGGGI